jgi:hypothetical protein
MVSGYLSSFLPPLYNHSFSGKTPASNHTARVLRSVVSIALVSGEYRKFKLPITSEIRNSDCSSSSRLHSVPHQLLKAVSEVFIFFDNAPRALKVACKRSLSVETFENF